MTRTVFEETVNGSACRQLHGFVEKEDFDTDGVKADVAIFEEEEDSNLLRATAHRIGIMKPISSFVRRQRVCAKALSAGMPFHYWKNQRNLKGPEYAVKPRFGSIKEEVLESGLVGAAEFESGVIQKALRYITTKKCRKMKSNEHISYQYDLKSGSPLEPRHLHSLFSYTDYTDFCTEFSRQFRAENEEEPLESINNRNSFYYHVSKALNEIVTLFGTSGYGIWNNNTLECEGGESGPFWCGLNCVLNVPEFAISFYGPTSTTKTKEIAVRFAGETGMLMVMNNQKGDRKNEKFLNVKAFSAFAEEDERLFMGSTEYLTVESLVVVQTAKNYRLSIGAYSKLDQVLKGHDVRFNISSDEVHALFGAMESVRGRGTEWKRSKYLDQFAVDNFYLMTLKKTEIELNLENINMINNKSFGELLFHSISKEHKVEGPNDTTNVLRGDLIPLFPNLSTITINIGYSFPFSVSRLLDELSAVDLPRSLSTIKIYGEGYAFLSKSVDTNLKQKAAAMNMTVEMEEGEVKVHGHTFTMSPDILTIGIHH